MLSREEIQELIDLTPDQKKAWTQLVRAIKRCKKANIHFYQVLSSLHGLNGNNIKRIDESEAYHSVASCEINEEANLQHLDCPWVETDCSWADDTHYVTIKNITAHAADPKKPGR